MNITVFFLFFSLVFLQILREREGGGYIKLGIKRNGLKVYLSFFFRRSSCGEYFLFYEPCPTTNFFFSFFRCREEGATSVLGSQPIIWLLSSSPLARRSVRATICHPVSHSFSIRSPSTSICFSILTWICYFGIDPHSYDVLTVILLPLLIHARGIVVILFLSS